MAARAFADAAVRCAQTPAADPLRTARQLVVEHYDWSVAARFSTPRPQCATKSP
jgi:hypothetical protein